MRISPLLILLTVLAAAPAEPKTCSADRVKGVSDWWWVQSSAKAEAIADWRARTGTRWSRAGDRSFYCVRILGAWQCHARGRACGH